MNTNTCPTCNAPIPPTAPGGFCPACILRDAEEPAPAGRAAPPIAEIAAAFPNLEVLGLIGQGGMGFVYKARQPSLDRVVALKILSPDLGRDPAFAERFAREARVLGKLNHPNIVTVFEHGESRGFFYLLMEFVDGVNLRQAMRAGRFTPQQALAVVPGICDALQAAHAQGVWHRDIKPENILLDAQGGVKIADFGIARIVGDPDRDFTLTSTGAALGSAAYMAPEQHEKPHDVDHRADIYSLGVVIYEMLTGELPLGRFPAPSRKAAVDARIDEIVFRTLEKERELRQQSAAEVKTDVQGASVGGQKAKKSKDVQGTEDVLRADDRTDLANLGVALRILAKLALAVGTALFIAAAVFTHGSAQGVLLTLASTGITLGGLGLLFGRNAAPDEPDAAKAAPITVRSAWLFVGGVAALIAGMILYDSPRTPHTIINLPGTSAGPLNSTEHKIGVFLLVLGGMSTLGGWCGLWYSLSLMKRGAISTTLRGFARTCAWLPVAFLVFAAGMWPTRRMALNEAELEAARRAEEQQRAAYQMRKDAETARAQLKTDFPDFSTPQGAVVAYEVALESGDTAGVLAAIPNSVTGKAQRPGDYANELIAKHHEWKRYKTDEAILISVSAPEKGPRIGAMDAESQKRILGRDPAGAVIVEYKARLFGKNPGILSSNHTCVKEGTEWRVIPSLEPSVMVETPPTPAPRAGRLLTTERIANGVRTVETKFVTDTGEVFPSVEAENLAEKQRAEMMPAPPVPPASAAPTLPNRSQMQSGRPTVPPPSGAPAPSQPASSTPANPVHVQVESTDAVELIYQMNALANAKNRDEFRKFITARYLPNLPGFRPPSDEDLMSAFAGKIIGVWNDLPNRRPYDPMRDRVAPMPEGPGFALAAGPTANLGPREKHGIVELERAEGNRDYYVVVFKWGRESLGFSRLELLPYVAKTRVDFRPMEGDPKAMLGGLTPDERVTQVFENGEAQAGRFDIRGLYSRTPADAVKSANQIIDHITGKLQKAGIADTLKIISPATPPEKPAFFSYPGISPVVRKPAPANAPDLEKSQPDGSK